MGLKTNENIAKWTNQTNKEIAYNTNRLNWDINQQQLDYSREMFNKELDYNYLMWNKTNEYNSPTNQLALWKAAGGNPYQYFSNNDVTSASSSSAPSASIPSQIPMQGYTAQGWQNQAPERIISALQTVMQGVGSYFNVDKTRADASMAWQDANFKSTEQTMQVMEGLRRMKGLDEDNKNKILNNYFDGMSMGNRLKRIDLDNNYVESQTNLAKLNYRLQSAQLPYVDQQAYESYLTIMYGRINAQKQGKLYDQELQNKKIEGSNLIKVGQLTDAQRSKVFKETYKIWQETNNMPKLNPQQQEELGRAIVKTATENAGAAEWEAGKQMFEWQKEQMKGKIGRKVEGFIDIINPLSGWK